MERVVVIGTSGSGKSTLAERPSTIPRRPTPRHLGHHAALNDGARRQEPACQRRRPRGRLPVPDGALVRYGHGRGADSVRPLSSRSMAFPSSRSPTTPRPRGWRGLAAVAARHDAAACPVLLGLRLYVTRRSFSA